MRGRADMGARSSRTRGSRTVGRASSPPAMQRSKKASLEARLHSFFSMRERVKEDEEEKQRRRFITYLSEEKETRSTSSSTDGKDHPGQDADRILWLQIPPRNRCDRLGFFPTAFPSSRASAAGRSSSTPGDRNRTSEVDNGIVVMKKPSIYSRELCSTRFVLQFPVVFFWGCTLGMFVVFLRWMFFADKHLAHELDGAPGGRAATAAEHEQHHEPAVQRHLVPLFFLTACPILCVLLLRYLAMALGSALALGKVDEACDTDWHAEYDAEVREGARDEKSAAAESHDQVLHFLLLPIPENATYAECQMWIDQLLLTPPSGSREAVVQQGVQEEQALASKNANWYTKENVVLLAMSSSGARGASGADGGWRTPVHDLLEQLQGRYREHFRDFCVIDAPGMFGGTDWEEGMYASRYAWGVLGAQEWLRQNRGHLGEGLLGAQSQCRRTTSVDESLIWVTCCDLSALLHRNYLPKLALDVLSQDEMLEEELHAADGANADATRNRRVWTIHQPPVLELRGYERLPSLLRAPDLYFSLKQLSDLYYANSSLAGVSTAHGCFSVSLSLLQHPFVDGLASDAISSGGLLAAKSLLAAVWGDLRSDDSSRRERLHLLSDREKTRQRIGAALAARNRSERRLQRTGDGRVESTVDTGDDLDEQDCEDVQESSFGATEYGPLVHLRPEGPHEDGSQVESEATEYHRTSAQGDPAFVPVPSVRVAPIWLPCNYCGMRRTGEGGGSFFEQCELYGARSRGTIEKSSYIGTASMAQLLSLLSSGGTTSSSSASATPRPWSSTLRIFWRIFFHQWLRHAAIPYLLDSGLLHSLLFVYALLQIPLWSAGKEHMTVRVAAVGGAVFLAYLLATLVLCGVAWGLLHRVLQGRIHPLYTRYGENAKQPMCSTSATLACGVAGLRLRYTQKGYLRDCSASSSSLILVPRLAFDDHIHAAPKWSSGELSIGSKIRLMFHALQDCCFSWLLSVPLFDVPAYLFVAHQFAADARTFALKGANAFAEEQDAAPRTETGADNSQKVVLSQTTKSLSSTSELMSTVWSDEGSSVTNSLVRKERAGGIIQPPSRVPTKDLHGRDVDSSVEKLYRKDDMITSELEEEDVVHFASLLRLWWKSGFSFRKLTEALKKEQERLGDEREKLLQEETETVEDFLGSTEADAAVNGEQIPTASPAPVHPVPCRVLSVSKSVVEQVAPSAPPALGAGAVGKVKRSRGAASASTASSSSGCGAGEVEDPISSSSSSASPCFDHRFRSPRSPSVQRFQIYNSESDDVESVATLDPEYCEREVDAAAPRPAFVTTSSTTARRFLHGHDGGDSPRQQQGEGEAFEQHQSTTSWSTAKLLRKTIKEATGTTCSAQYFALSAGSSSTAGSVSDGQRADADSDHGQAKCGGSSTSASASAAGSRRENPSVQSGQSSLSFCESSSAPPSSEAAAPLRASRDSCASSMDLLSDGDASAVDEEEKKASEEQEVGNRGRSRSETSGSNGDPEDVTSCSNATAAADSEIGASCERQQTFVVPKPIQPLGMRITSVSCASSSSPSSAAAGRSVPSVCVRTSIASYPENYEQETSYDEPEVVALRTGAAAEERALIIGARGPHFDEDVEIGTARQPVQQEAFSLGSEVECFLEALGEQAPPTSSRRPSVGSSTVEVLCVGEPPSGCEE